MICNMRCKPNWVKSMDEKKLKQTPVSKEANVAFALNRALVRKKASFLK